MIENEIVLGDCVAGMAGLPAGKVDLLCADPPFNIGLSYDKYQDSREDADYLRWSREWLGEAVRVLSPTGSFWLAIGDSYVSELDVMCRREFGLTRRNWMVWTYNFGQNGPKKFTPSHTHLLSFVANPKNFTFNADAVKLPSARQLVYADKQAKAGGRVPGDVWALLPQEAPWQLNGESDVWLESRVCGTFKERVKHVCQMPLAILDRVIKVSSNPGDLVLDPFVGSGTTLVAAKRLGRRYAGFELSPNYAAIAQGRLDAIPSLLVEDEVLAHN